MSDCTALRLTEQLVKFASISRVSNLPVADFLSEQLDRLGFEIERVAYADKHGVEKLNLVAKKGSGTGGLAYFAHNDVVPADDWSYPKSAAFEPFVENGRLYGRGSCDMKGSIACMLEAVSRVGDHDFQAPFYFVCTADEEIGFGGACEVAKSSVLFGEMVAHQTKAIIGEPTSLNVVHGHKGIIGIRVTSHGRTAHSGTTEGINANLQMIPFLSEMKKIHDESKSNRSLQNPEFDPPDISMNIGINDFTRAYNITPGKSVSTICFRPMPGQDSDPIVARIEQTAKELGLEFELDSFGQPVYTNPDSDFVQSALRLTGNSNSQTVSYGTDGGEFAGLQQLIVCGPGSIAQAHKPDEWIEISQLVAGAETYERLLREHVLS